MSALFSKPGSSPLSLPRVPSPLAIPSVGPEVSDLARKRAQRRGGFRKTFLTGASEPEKRGLKTTLG